MQNKSKKNTFNVIGLMSGTSLDGLDIAYVEFRYGKEGWRFKIVNATTIKYTRKWKDVLATSHLLSSAELLAAHAAYGRFLGKTCKTFMEGHAIKKVDFIASHGHTVFHQPHNGFTFQLGDVYSLHAESGIPVIGDFRSLDVAFGGEGAPLVPVGDHFLFQDYDLCLNLGGIANISVLEKRSRIAFDVSFCNLPLNYLMESLGHSFDRNGEKAASGTVNRELLAALTRIYRPLQKKRASLGREIFETSVKPLLAEETISLEDKLATCVESTALEIAEEVVRPNVKSVLCTGGGAYNSYLMSRLLEHCKDQVALVIPDDDVVKFKEALIFAFLGVLRFLGKPNSLKTVTGATKDSSAGAMVGFKL